MRITAWKTKAMNRKLWNNLAEKAKTVYRNRS